MSKKSHLELMIAVLLVLYATQASTDFFAVAFAFMGGVYAADALRSNR